MSDQPKPTSGDPCHVTGPSSRICEHGTKSCEVRHIKPTVEWAGLSLARLIKEKGYKGAADAHNAALAAHRKEMETVTMNTSDIETVQQLREQLAAEREKRENSDRKWIVAAGQLRQQLADERRDKEVVEHKRKSQSEAYDRIRAQHRRQISDWVAAAEGLQQQLAAELEKARMLVDALKSINSQLCANFPLGTNREIIQEIDDALAKVKDGK